MTQSISTFPTSFDSFDDPIPGDLLGGPSNTVDHIEHTQWIIDALEKLEAKVGIDGSLVATSLDRQMEVHAHTGATNDGGAIAISDTSGSITEAQHGVFTAGDLHEQYASVAESETITATWLFEQNITFEDAFTYFGGFIEGIQAVSTDMAFNSFTTNDAEYRFQLRADGQMSWGGGTLVADTNLYRSAANELMTDDSLVVAGSIKQSTTKVVLDTDHTAAADPHTGYRLESADHSHATTGLQGGTIAGSDLTGTPGGELGGTFASFTVDATHSGSSHAGVVSTHEGLADPHTGYMLESLFDAKGDIITASADNTPAKTTVGANDTILMADSAASGGVKWVASQAPSNFALVAAEGTADTYSRGDHVHQGPQVDHDHSANTSAGGGANISVGTTFGLAGEGDFTDTGTQTALSPTNWSSKSIFQWKGGSTLTIQGLTAQGGGDIKVVHDIGTGGITFVNESLSASSFNRIQTPGATDFTTSAGDVVVLEYNNDQARWRVWSAPDRSALTTHAAAADPHTGYLKESEYNAKGDLITASANDTPSVLTVGANDTMLMADSTAGGGLKWVAPAASAVTITTGGTDGTADNFSRGDHAHAHEAAHLAHDTLWDAKGDVVTGSASDTAVRTAIGADGTILQADSTAPGGVKWDTSPPAGGSAPDSATYLTTTANATLTSEVVVGATPGGELGGTWASPTVDAVHSGSAHTAIDASTFWDAKGDLIAGTGADAAANVGVGANNTMLVADSAQTAGVKWANIVEANITAGTITAASIANRTRSLYIPAALIQTVSGVAAVLGTEPDQLDTKRLDDAATDAAYAQFQIPSDWATGALTLRFWLSMAGTSVATAVRLDVTYKEMNGADPIAAGTNIAAANITLTSTVNPQSTDFTLGTPGAVDRLWRVCVRRTGGNAGDTYAQNLRILGFEIRYTADG